MYSIEPRIVNIIWACSPISFKHVLFKCPFLDPHLITHHSSAGVYIIAMLELGTSTLRCRLRDVSLLCCTHRDGLEKGHRAIQIYEGVFCISWLAQTTTAHFPGESGSWVFFGWLLWWGRHICWASGVKTRESFGRSTKWILLCMVIWTIMKQSCPMYKVEFKHELNYYLTCYWIWGILVLAPWCFLSA